MDKGKIIIVGTLRKNYQIFYIMLQLKQFIFENTGTLICHKMTYKAAKDKYKNIFNKCCMSENGGCKIYEYLHHLPDKTLKKMFNVGRY